MTTLQRAKSLVGDMPWVTEKLTQMQIDDMIKQVEACLFQIAREEKERCAKFVETYPERVYVLSEERHILDLVATDLRK